MTGDLGKADLARKRFFENIERKKQGLPELKEDAEFEKEVYDQIHNSTMDVLKYLSGFAPVYTLQGNVGWYTDAQAKEKSKKVGSKLISTESEIRKLGNIHLTKNRLRLLDDNLRVGFLEIYTDTSWVKRVQAS